MVLKQFGAVMCRTAYGKHFMNTAKFLKQFEASFETSCRLWVAEDV